MKIDRAVVRKRNGVPELEDSPYLPSTLSTVTNNRSAGLSSFVLGAVLAVVGIVAGAGAMYLRISPTPEPVEFDQVEQLLQADNTWKPTGKTARIRTMPNGTVQTRDANGNWK